MTAPSPYRTLFIVGCPRSGTTWMQLLLSQHPAIATAPETQIFAYYIDQMRRQWRHEHDGPVRREQGGAGLSRLLSEDEFDELCRNAARQVLDRIAARKPGARIVVEKSPRHALSAEYISRLFPTAAFLHVVRDPRDTAASLMQAARTWGRGWAPANAIEAARMWRAHVEAARLVAGDTARYKEVRYEVLHAEPAATLQEILSWLGIDEDAAFCTAAMQACDLTRLKDSANEAGLPMPAARAPDGFLRNGKIGGWRDELSAGEVSIVEHVCGDAMSGLGYTCSALGRARPTRVLAHDALARIRESIDWQLARLLNVI